MNDSLLVYCYPTYSKALHINSKNDSVVLAPDEMLLALSRNHRVDVVNLSPFASTLPLMRSKIIMKTLEEVNPLNYSYCWHMFRDPLPIEVSELLMKLNIEAQFPEEKTINMASALYGHFKHDYLRVLFGHGIGPRRIFDQDLPADIQWGKTEWSVTVSTCKRFIRVYNFNNCRGDYPEWEKKSHLVVEYADSAKNGMRSFFRIGFACGQVTPGWMYYQPDSGLIQKTGTATQKELYSLPQKWHGIVKDAMKDMRIDIAHLEGCFVEDKLVIFDVNAYPTSYGGTLAPISEAMATVISDIMRQGKNIR